MYVCNIRFLWFAVCIAFLSIAHKFCFHVESECRTTSDATFGFLRMQKLCKIVMCAEKTRLLKRANVSFFVPNVALTVGPAENLFYIDYLAFLTASIWYDIV